MQRESAYISAAIIRQETLHIATEHEIVLNPSPIIHQRAWMKERDDQTIKLSCELVI